METPENIEAIFKIYLKIFAYLAIPGSMALGVGGIVLAISYKTVRWILNGAGFDDY